MQQWNKVGIRREASAVFVGIGGGMDVRDVERGTVEKHVLKLIEVSLLVEPTNLTDRNEMYEILLISGMESGYPSSFEYKLQKSLSEWW
jgi:hypothetical protein